MRKEFPITIERINGRRLEKVEIKTKTYKKGGSTKAVRWECDGSPEYVMEDIDKAERGTEVILHIDKENKEFLENFKIKELLSKYCKFLPVPIQFGMEKVQEPIEGKKDKDGNQEMKEVEKPNIINNTHPLWKKKPSECTDEEYNTLTS